ncbi:hypothetical protein GCM10009720_25270 [Yaniella flava]|uniref:HTH merR-type domain-containing protein n=1 Tax=Yaniella flava TaxID=287930 RepID=A0ABN2UV09_9MICC|nr:DUF433 domain-containing protein [Micrococcaceae bacterium]
MGFPEDLTSALTGASVYQLREWRNKGLLIPEVRRLRPPLYSFRDLVAVRAVVFLRSQVSLQRIGKAFKALKELDLTDHPSRYAFGVHDKDISVETADGDIIDLIGKKGQHNLFRLDQIFRPFENFKGNEVVDFEHPRPNLELNHGRLGGWPTITGTRVPYQNVANLLTGGDYSVKDIEAFYPSVSVDAVDDAVSFHEQVKSLREPMPA